MVTKIWLLTWWCKRSCGLTMIHQVLRCHDDVCVANKQFQVAHLELDSNSGEDGHKRYGGEVDDGEDEKFLIFLCEAGQSSPQTLP